MKCQEIEALLCDYLDNALQGEQRTAFGAHLAQCEGCRQLVHDVRGAMAFLEHVEAAAPPPELVTRILFHIPARAAAVRRRPGFLGWIQRLFQPAMQPRFAMGMAMTILSFAMLGRFTGISVRQLSPADLNPAQVWRSAEDKVHRGWERLLKYYENIRLVYEIQTRLKEWTAEEEERRLSDSGAPAAPAPPDGQGQGEETSP